MTGYKITKENKQYRAIVTNYNGSVRKSRWYQTWGEAQIAGERLSDQNTKSIKIIDQTGYIY